MPAGERSAGETRNAQILFEANEYGGRLKYLGRPSAPEFWDEQWVRKEAELHYPRYEAGFMPRHLRRTFLRWVPRGSRVLEAGCGLGRFTIAATHLGYEAEGVDFAPLVIERLKARYPKMPFFVGDVTHLVDVPDGRYDAVYSPGVCEHFERGPEAVLSETHRILKPGGIALVHCPCFNPLRRALVTMGMFRERTAGAFYQYAFSRAELRERLEKLGFEVVAIEPFDVGDTLGDHVPGFSTLLTQPVGHLLSSVLDWTPGLRSCGHCAVWVARKPA